MAAALLTGLLSATIVGTVAAPAGAHTPNVSASCSTLSVSLQSYARSDSNPRPNKVTVTVDGGNVASEWFGGSFVRDFSLGDSSKAHAWRVVVDAVDNYDRTFEGTSTPCAPPVVKDAAAALHTTPATCTSPATLVLDSIVNATWSVPTRTQGPGDYAVTATAATGHVFDDGKTSRAFTGTLAGALGAGAPGCSTTPPPTTPPPTTPPTTTPPTTPPRVTPDKPAPVSTSSRTEAIECADAMITITTTTVTTDWVLNAAGTDWVPAEPVTTSSTSMRPVTPGDCPDVSDGGGSGGDTGGETGGENGGGSGAGGDGVGGDGEGIVGSVFEIGPEFGSAGGVGSLAQSGANASAAIFLAISLLAAGGIILLRRRREKAVAETGALED